MIICLCHRVSDGDLERAVRSGCTSFDELQDDTRVATGCGACADCARDVFSTARAREGTNRSGAMRLAAACVPQGAPA